MRWLYLQNQGRPLRSPDLLFLLEEEVGLVGSRSMVKKIKKEEVDQYCAMINIDSLGMAAPLVLQNVSSKTLTARVGEIALRMKMPFNTVNVPGAGADSQPFMEKKIPAVTISALGNGWADLYIQGTIR